MTPDFNICYSAVKRRDPGFDGLFFTGVKSTGIFCRPVCPAMTPKPENCRFFDSASAALSAGYRPCLRCRPETTPGSPAWNGTRTTVRRALNLIDMGALDEGGVSCLADRLGIGERYLRQLFSRHVGVSPYSLAKARRLSHARRLVLDSSFSMTEIALKSGFRSIRQFNDNFLKEYGYSPRSLRKSTSVSMDNDETTHL